jgi:hypothetical protein
VKEVLAVLLAFSFVFPPSLGQVYVPVVQLVTVSEAGVSKSLAKVFL